MTHQTTNEKTGHTQPRFSETHRHADLREKGGRTETQARESGGFYLLERVSYRWWWVELGVVDDTGGRVMIAPQAPLPYHLIGTV